MAAMINVVETEKAQIEKVITTTPSQMEIWLACKLGGKEANKAYNESISVKLEGELDVNTLQKAFLKVSERHDGMRSVVSPNGKSFLVYSSYSLPIRMRDVSGLSTEEKESYLLKHAEQTGTYHFNLTQGPLYVLDLIKLDEHRHLLTFTGHHIIFDGWSLGVLLEELGFFYSSILTGEIDHLPHVDRFGSYAQEFYNLTRKSTYKKTKEFWKAYLSDPVPKFTLPSDKTAQPIRTFTARRHEQKISDITLKKTKTVAAKLGASFNLTLLAIFELFLSDWTGQNDVIVGLPVAGQLGLDKQRLIGHCVNLLPLRSNINPTESFVDYLKKRKEDYFLALEFSFISFGEIIKDIPVNRNAFRIPLVPVTFNIDTAMGDAIGFKGLTHQLISNPKAFSNFEIVLNLFGASDGHVFEWTFNTDLFTQSKIEEASSNYARLIEAFLENPYEKIDKVLRSLNTPQVNTKVRPYEFFTIGELLKNRLTSGKESVAVCYAGQEYSYAQLNEKVNTIAAHLLLKGAGPGKIVGVHLERSVDLVASTLAVIQVGACYMPIDSEYPEDRVKFMLKDVDVKVFLTDNEAFSWGILSNKKLKIDHFIYENSIPGFITKTPKPEDPLFIVYTSGSTGTPKGVALSQRNLSDFLIHFEQAPGFKESDRVVGLSSISFDMSFMELVLPFVYGASLHLLDKFERRDSREIIKILNEGSVTKLYATPSHLKSILDYGLSDGLKHLTIISAGEPLQYALAQSLVRRSGKLYNIYGPTETTIFTNIKEITLDTQEITIGKPVLGTTILLIDEQGKLITNPGELGEVYIGGKGVGIGYLNRDTLNRERFIENPLPTGTGRYYRTGDLAVWTLEGELICKGRLDHQVKIRGQRVELCEIENSIALDSDIEHVMVDKAVSEYGDDELVALVSFKNGKKVSMDSERWIATCKEELRRKLPIYMIPGSFLVVQHFELNQNGKVDRKLARKFVKLKDTEPKALPSLNNTKENSNLVAELLNLWNKFLDVSENQLDCDFFQLGGHSLMAVDLISLIEKKFGLNLPLSILFEYPTLNSLAIKLGELAATTDTTSSILVKFKEGDPQKVLFFIHGVGLNPLEIKTLNEYMDENQTIWGLQSPSILSQKTAPLDNIEDIAALYISEIKKMGYVGVYKLLGNSFGGQIAFEMARQLTQAGDKIDFLGMIDTVASLKPHISNNIFENLLVISKKILFEINFLMDDPFYYFHYRMEYLKGKIDKIYKAPELSEQVGLKSRISQIEKVNMQAWKNYNHKFIDTEITLFLAEKRTFFVPDFKTFGWLNLVSRIDTITMPGDHANMLKPPYGMEFSRSLQKLINSSK